MHSPKIEPEIVFKLKKPIDPAAASSSLSGRSSQGFVLRLYEKRQSSERFGQYQTLPFLRMPLYGRQPRLVVTRKDVPLLSFRM